MQKKAIFVIISLILCIKLSNSVPNPSKSPKKSTSISDLDRQRFQSWKQKHKKSYQSTADEDKALSTLVKNMREIEAHNVLYAAGKTTYTRALWEQSDLSFEEKQQFLSGLKELESKNDTILRFVRAAKLKASPPELNLVKAGLVNPIQDQKKCGSCWTYAAAGVAEGVLLRKGIKTRLSEQNLVDCSKNGGNSGCNGGDAYYALKYIASSGIAAYDDYPYTARSGKCRASSVQKVPLKLGSIKYERLRGNENRLKDIVANYGPVAVAIRAADSFMNYESGVYNNPKCSRNLDHAVLLVGYGHDNKTNLDYWLVKNSWGTTWGEDGYVRMARNKDNQCGIAVEVAYVI
ncbi:cathepsin L-like peptidase [Chironomus tepperi]|uniref:cathepsin L-like peptidase n=1 Tax=Chironomus tepperi TaxID=113505 RepID=UPI00391F7EC9